MNGEDWAPQMGLSPLQKSCEDVCKTKSQIVRERRSSQIGCSFVVSETVPLLLRFTEKFTKLSRKTFPGLIVFQHQNWFIFVQSSTTAAGEICFQCESRNEI